MAEKSFLATVKEELDTQFASIYDDLAEVCPADEILSDTLTKLRKGVWTVVERRLKDSFQNGKKATNGRTDTPSKERKPNPFRKE